MSYKDRTAGLIIFGGLTILLGFVALGLDVLILVSQNLVPKDQSLGMGALLPSLLAYVIIGFALIVLGIGSIMARRWARALLLIFSWCWLAFGVIEMVVLAIILPLVISNAASLSASTDAKATAAASAVSAAMVFTLGILSVILILMPGAWTFFYYSPHVKATCEARDPNPSWTDACPLPVLAISLWMWLCVPTMLLMPFSGHLVLPLFGTFATGLPAAFLSVCFAVAWAVGGWLNFRLDIRGWWLLVIVILLGTISTVVTFCFHNIVDLYRAGNYPPGIIDQMSKLSFFNGSAFAWIMGLVMLPFLGYLLFVRRYFSQQS
jgi:hypothetical protein